MLQLLSNMQHELSYAMSDRYLNPLLLIYIKKENCVLLLGGNSECQLISALAIADCRLPIRCGAVAIRGLSCSHMLNCHVNVDSSSRHRHIHLHIHKSS